LKVSVIVTTFNRADLVRETIDSILNQTFQDFELIVVDNCSCDNTEEVVNNYQDKRIRYFRNDNNGVIAVNRNFGIAKARGEYVAFCDDDDLWLPEKLERQVAEFAQNKAVSLVCTNATILNEKGKLTEFYQIKPAEADFTFNSLLRHSQIICSSVMVKKSVIDDVGLMDVSPELFSVEDYELWLRIASKYRIKYIDQPLLKYRVHPGNVQKKSFAAVKRHRAAYRKLKKKGVIGSWTYYRLGVRSFLLELLWRTHTIGLASRLKGLVSKEY
jgi:teichuronic acid biosynthesis glycosyltransferase TuaG